MSEESERRSRLRWVTLGEAVAIAAVVISGLTFWNSYEDRRDAREEKVAATHARPLRLKATADAEGDRLALAPVDETQPIQGQVVRLPPGFGVAPVTTSSDARIEAGWFADALKADRKRRHLSDDAPGDARVPVMIETSYLANGDPAKARAFYDVGYALEGRFLRGTAVRLRGLSLIGQAPADDKAADARLATLWASRARG
ncbi:hypothetical protein [Sphingomonas sp.]|uniref:hypothetical protein n=1 Tax=Sphingomonas sp. TaxID=28214 RepID=UPI003AFFEB3E